MIYFGMTAFDKVFLRNAAETAYADYTSAASGVYPAADVYAASTPVTVGDALYLGHSVNRFGRLSFLVTTTSTVQIELEYYKAGAWITVPGTTSNGKFYNGAGAKWMGDLSTDSSPITAPSSWRDGWDKTTVLDYEYYWMRLRLTEATGNRPVLSNIQPYLTLPNPQDIEDTEDIFGGVHEIADGSRALDGIARRMNWLISWTALDANDYQSVRDLWGWNYVFGIKTNWTDAISGAASAVLDPAAGLKMSRQKINCGVLYDAQIGLMSGSVP